jgi:hypothetical protein
MLRSAIKNVSLALLAGALFVGCGGAETKEGDNGGQPITNNGGTAKNNENEVEAWYDSPEQFGTGLYGVGGAPMNSPLAAGATRVAAVERARAELARNMEAKIQGFVKLWAESSGDASDAATISELYRNESFTRSFVNKTVKNAVVKKSRKPKKSELPDTYWVLVELKPKDFFEQFKEQVVNDTKKRKTRKETRVMSRVAENELDKMIAKEEKKLEEQQKSISQTYNLPQ